jgi:hypothetical protein
MAEAGVTNPGPGAGSQKPGEETALPNAFLALCRGVLYAIGMFDPRNLAEEDPAQYRIWFHLGETGMAAQLAGTIAVPAGAWFAGITALPLACIGAAVLFLPLFVFLPKLIRSAMKADTDAVLAAFGRNEQTKKVFWALFTATAGLVLAQVLDPAAAQQIVAAIAGIVP